MKNNSPSLTILVGFFLLGAMAVAGVAAIEYVGTLFMNLEPHVAQVTASGLIVVLIAALIIARSIRDNGASTLRFRSKRAVAYKNF
jgi:hypothetical protein